MHAKLFINCSTKVDKSMLNKKHLTFLADILL
jgi:hypothetical protein